MLLGFVGVTWVGEIYNKKFGMGVIAEKMRICCYLHIRKSPYIHDVS